MRPEGIPALFASMLALIGAIVGGIVAGTMLYADRGHRLAAAETEISALRNDLKDVDRRLNDDTSRIDLLTWRLDHPGAPPPKGAKP